MKTKKMTAKVVLTFALVVICIAAIPSLFAEGIPDEHTIPEHYFIKAFGIKLVSMIIMASCVTVVMAIWSKSKTT